MNAPLSTYQESITHYTYLSLLPFFIGALGPWVLADYELWFSQALVNYSTIILAFLSGSLWSLSLSTGRQITQQHIYATSSFLLIVFTSYFFPLVYQIATLLTLFLLVLLWEKRFLNDRYPNWYQQLRHRTSFIVIACHMLAVFNLIRP